MIASVTSTFQLTPTGAFSWEQACEFVAHFPPLRRNWTGTGDPLRIAFLLDGTFEPFIRYVLAAHLHYRSQLITSSFARMCIDFVAPLIKSVYHDLLCNFVVPVDGRSIVAIMHAHEFSCVCTHATLPVPRNALTCLHSRALVASA